MSAGGTRPEPQMIAFTPTTPTRGAQGRRCGHVPGVTPGIA
jgi:hypothetical protein